VEGMPLLVYGVFKATAKWFMGMSIECLLTTYKTNGKEKWIAWREAM
jgi:hypothetical protein